MRNLFNRFSLRIRGIALFQNGVQPKQKPVETISQMMSAILHVRDAVVGDPMVPLTSNLKLRTHVMCITEKEKMMQNVGAVVCKVFDGRRYHGRIFDVDYHEIYARWMYKVKYSDGDTEDYWTCEIDNLKCRCADLDHNHTLI